MNLQRYHFLNALFLVLLINSTVNISASVYFTEDNSGEFSLLENVIDAEKNAVLRNTGTSLTEYIKLNTKIFSIDETEQSIIFASRYQYCIKPPMEFSLRNSSHLRI